VNESRVTVDVKLRVFQDPRHLIQRSFLQQVQINPGNGAAVARSHLDDLYIRHGGFDLSHQFRPMPQRPALGCAAGRQPDVVVESIVDRQVAAGRIRKVALEKFILRRVG
jgi:hypothetical protein